MKKTTGKTPVAGTQKPPAGRSRQRLRQDEFATAPQRQRDAAKKDKSTQKPIQRSD